MKKKILRFMVPDIAALLQNSCSNYEIIIVDDNSTDGTNILVKNFMINIILVLYQETDQSLYLYQYMKELIKPNTNMLCG